MRSIISMDTVQIEITNVCKNKCSNCSRFVGHHKNPYFMTFDDFKRAIDSMVDYPKMIGFQGGEPLLHPDFEKMCKYASSKID
jgi:MoaA/NifB/PqqE/SkfB family radical SAM enzyme